MQRALRLLIACVCAVPFIIVGSPAGPAAAAGGTVTGVVTDTAGIPIPGASVVLLRAFPGGGTQVFGQTTAGPDGAYSVADVPAGDWVVGAGAIGFAARVGNAQGLAGASAIAVVDGVYTFDPVLPRTTAVISGVVTAEDTGLPLAGVQVAVDASPGYPLFGAAPAEFSAYSRRVLTGANGQYTIENFAPGTVLVAFATQYFGETGFVGPSPYVSEVYIDAPNPSTATLVELAEGTVTSGIDAALARGATVSGRVTDANGLPVPDTSVTTNIGADIAGAITDADGNYTLVGLPSGTFQLSAFDAANGAPTAYVAPGEAGAFTPVIVEVGGTYTGFDIQFRRYENVAMTVFRSDGALTSPAVVACRAPGEPQLVPTPPFAPQLRCSTGSQVFPLSGAAVQRLAEGTYRAAAQILTGTFPQQTTQVSATVEFTVVAGTPLDCTFVIEGAASCAPTDPATIDGDGVAAVVEDAAPNGGDGNGDGIRDATQSNVTSLPFAIGTGYATVVVDPPLTITRASLLAPSSPVFGAETGEFSVEVGGVPVGGTADITILRTNAGPATALTTGPNVFGGPRRQIPAEFTGTTIVAHIVDGGPFDPSTNPVGTTPPDGVVRLFAIPSIVDDVPPVITCPSPAPTFPVGAFTFMTATVTDEGSGVSGPTTLQQFVFPTVPGSFSVTFSASDVAGNRTTQACGYTVVALPTDTTPPTIVCNSFGVPAFPVGSVASVSAFASDDVGLATPPLMAQAVDTTVPGSFSVLFTATDLAGNTAQQFCGYTVFRPDTTPPVVQCFDPGPYLVQGTPVSVFSFAFDETGPAFIFATATIDVSVEGTFTGTITASDAAGNVGSADCPYTVVSDFDDVPSAIEDGAPNGGDGNADGAPDRSQSNVASLVQPDGSGYATVVDRSGNTLSSVTTEAFDGAALPAGADLVSATYLVRWNSSFGNPSLIVHDERAFDTLLVRNPDGWVPSSGLVFDGDAADTDGPGNGTVTVRLAAANVDRTPPTVTCSDFTTFLLRQPGATVTVTASDDGSGVDTPVQTFPVDTSVLGDGVVTVEVADRAGNVAQADCGYRVGVRISRLSSPRPGDVTAIQRGRVLAVRWTVTDFFGRGVSDPAHFQSVDVEGGWTCPRRRTENGDRTAPGLRYLGRGRWEYGWRAPSTPQCLSLELHVVGDARTALVLVR